MEIKFNAIYQEKYYYWHNESDREVILKLILNPEIHIGVQIFQFTGMKDNNKREVFEGDIVKTNYGNAEVVFNSPSFGVLVEKECGIGEYPHEMEDRFYELDWENDAFFYYDEEKDKQSCRMEVIGQISANPKLLEGD